MKFRLLAVFLVGLASAFNTFAIHLGGRPLSAGLIAIALYFMSFMSFPLQKTYNAIISVHGKFLILPLFYIILLTMMNLVYYDGSVSVFPFAIFMNWIFFLALLCHSVTDHRAIDYCFYGFSLGGIILSVLFFYGIGVEVNITREGDRLSMFGSNENVLGIIQCFNFCIILNHFILNDRLHLKVYRLLFLIPLLLSSSMIIATGSRTALFISVVIFIITFLFLPTSKASTKLVLILLGAILLFVGVTQFLQSDSAMLTRIMSTFDEGNTGGRTDIWAKYLLYFPDHPVLGVGESGMLDIAIASGVGTTNITGSTTALSPHNVFVQVLMTTGIVGFIIMTVFWYHTFKSAFRGYRRFKLLVPLLFAIPIIAVLMSGQLLGEKYGWMAYAYMIASSKCNIIR